MGQLLSHPIQEKALDYHSQQTFSYSIGSMQGYRMTMEDAHSVKINEDESLAIFGVFDGHGGHSAADYVSDRLPSLLFKELQQRQFGAGLRWLVSTMKNTFFQVDHDLYNNDASHCGTTAIIAALVDQRYIIVGNTGDSRCILSLPGGHSKTLSFDHKPSTMGERVRIENSGGYVINNRVNEILALSRAFGDFKFKIPYVEPSRDFYYNESNKEFYHNGLVKIPPELNQVTVEPDFLVYDIKGVTEMTGEPSVPEFIILACDGIWDCYTNKDLVKVIRDKLALGWLLTHITELVLNNCIEMANNITGIGFDNMTMIIVALHPNGNINQWYEEMKVRILKEKDLV